ncbi:FtsX-like permease family protein [Rhodocytophaga rosea]|uniref:FtsX-like permease family protein n=1 Tax=Rhodocytophaga rosea TaxID=2704465 RepID=A0A6C0GQS5_9BACT|nr:ABC transporter permease [Rhodocytophaga rosea]QHT70428.1 FtsX-like permease family protein [Rhodocytophaga rosea]
MLRNYLMIACRNLLRHKTHTILNVLGLALGVTCSLLIFLLVKFHLTADAHHSNASQIYRVVTEMHMPEGTTYSPGSPVPLGEALKNDFPQIKKVSMLVANYGFLLEINNPGKNSPDRFLQNNGIALVEPAFFDMFDYRWIAGNPVTALTEPNSVVLTRRSAEKFFGDQNPIGKVMKADNRINLKVTGLLEDSPANTDLKYDMFVSYSTHKDINPQYYKGNWGWINSATTCYVLLSEGFDAAQLTKALPDLHKKYYSAEDAKVFKHVLQPLSDIHFNQQYYGEVQKQSLYVMALIGLFIIVIACINFINLSTAQAIRRAKEVGVRKVLGSTRLQLFWQFINETAILTLLAILLSIVLSSVALPYQNALMDTQLQVDFFQDGYLLTFLVALTALVILFSGLYPSLILSGFKPVTALKGRISAAQVGGLSLRRGLVIVQFTLSQALIIGMLVIAYQMHYFRNADLGFQKEAILNITLFDRDKTTLQTFRNKLLQLPEVAKVSFSLTAPVSNGNNNYDFIRFDSRTEKEGFQVNVKAADHHFLDLYGLQLVAGRNYLPSDSMREVVINETLMHRLGITDPETIIGKPLHIWEKSFPIVGVVKDFHLHSLHNEIDPMILAPVNRDYLLASVQLHTQNLQKAIGNIESAWTQVFANQVFEYAFLDETIARYYQAEEVMATLTNVFAGIAVFISCLGLYGLVSFMAIQKTKEIGIRKVLGASVSQIILLFTKEFARLLLIAFLIAAPLAGYFMHQWLEDYPYGIKLSADIFLWAILITCVIAGITVCYQSVKAAIANPVKSLRNE